MPWITKRRGKWAIEFYDYQGKRRLKTLPAGTTKTKAKEVLRGLEDQLAKGNYIPDKKIPVFAEVAKDWIEYKKPNLRESTWSVYEGHVRNHFHELDSLKINRINTAIIEKFITTRQNRNMNIATIRKVLVSLGQIMAYAVRHGYIDHNPVRDAERPRDQGKDEPQKIQILIPSEIKALIDATQNMKYRTLFMLAVMSGARQGELLGLKWTDVDWFNSQIHIQRTFNNSRWYKPKTKTSNRRVDIGPTMMTELKKWKLACSPCELDLVFPNNSGKPINYSNMVSRHFAPVIKKAGLPQIRFHGLRHTYASLLIEQGENIKYIQSQLGHSSPTVTLNIYAHLIKPVNQEAPRRLEEIIFSQSGDKMETTNKKRLQDKL